MKKKSYNNELIVKYLEKNNIDEIEFCKRCCIDIKDYIKIGSNDLDIEVRKIIQVITIIGCRIEDFILINKVDYLY